MHHFPKLLPADVDSVAVTNESEVTASDRRCDTYLKANNLMHMVVTVGVHTHTHTLSKNTLLLVLTSIQRVLEQIRFKGIVLA